MDGSSSSRSNGIRQIVRLKEMLQKWQAVTLNPRIDDDDPDQTHGDIVPINKTLANIISCDSDEEIYQIPEPPPDVPEGYLAVYVGPELRRFIIPTSYLSHSVFKVLLEKAEEEFGFDHDGGLTLPCEIETFKYLLKCVENNQKAQCDDTTDERSLADKE